MMMTIIPMMTPLAYAFGDSCRNLSTLIYQLWRKQNPTKLTPTILWYIYHNFLFLHKTSARLPSPSFFPWEKFFLWLALAGIPVKALHSWPFMTTVCHNEQYYQSTNNIIVLSLLAVFTLCILFRVTWCLEKSSRSEVIWQISLCHFVAWLAFQVSNNWRCSVLGLYSNKPGHYSLLVSYPTSASWHYFPDIFSLFWQ